MEYPTLEIRCPDCGISTEVDTYKYRGNFYIYDGEIVFICPACAKRVWEIKITNEGIDIEDKGRP